MYDALCEPVMYKAQGKEHDFLDLTCTLCPHCKKNYLKKHGYYKRHLCTDGFDGEIMIRRHICAECKRTVSVLPSFCHPLRTYGTSTIVGVLKEFYEKASSVSTAISNHMKESAIEYSRQQLLHYRKRIMKNLNSLVMSITAIYELKEPLIAGAENIKEKVRQLFSFIKSPQDESLKIFRQTRTTYLTPKAI
jgi:hypothetical protein